MQTNETIQFQDKKFGGNDPKKNNPLYEIEVYSQEYEFIVNLIMIIKPSFETLRLLWCGSALTWTSNSRFRSSI